MKINWTVRLKNPQWWAQIAISLVIPVLSYFGMTGADITTWGTLWDTVLRAVSNPYVIVLAAVSVYNAIVDPTTAGIGDSLQALNYTSPKKESVTK